ncbi:MAG: GYF domain-containing protein [Planctomycetaceae bacterium]
MAANWHYAKGGEKHGPITSAQLKEMAVNGQLSPDDLVWREDMKEWRKASTVKGLLPEQVSTTSPPPPPPSSKIDKTDEVAIWERPAILALLIVCCFPVGLILVWKNARMTTKEKGLWTAACGGVIALLFLFNTFMTQGVEKDLARANTLWTEGKQPEAVALYRTVLNNRDMYIPDDQKPVVYGRVIDHLAQQGEDEEARKLIEKLQRYAKDVIPLVDSSEGKRLLAKLKEEGRQTTSGKNRAETFMGQIEQMGGTPTKQYDQRASQFLTKSNLGIDDGVSRTYYEIHFACSYDKWVDVFGKPTQVRTGPNQNRGMAHVWQHSYKGQTVHVSGALKTGLHFTPMIQTNELKPDSYPPSSWQVIVHAVSVE